MTRKQNEQAIDANEVVRRYYEEGSPSESEGSRDGTEPVSSAAERTGKPERPDQQTARLSGGDADVSAQGADAGTETPGGSNPTPDQDLVDEIGKSVGVTYQDNEPLKFGEKAAERDRTRWELNPASSEDYQERGADEPEATRKRRSSSTAKTPSKGSKRTRGKRSTS
jgi:hypothetical protein